MKKTKIICTLGPNSKSEKVIKRMYENGMNAARINLSYGDFEQYDEMIRNVSDNTEVPIILDTQGPEVRIKLDEDEEFQKNDEVSVELSRNVYNKLSEGVKVLFNDGLNQGRITRVEENRVVVKMVSDGVLEPNSSVLFEKVNLNLPLLTKKDEKGIRYAKKKELSFIAVSYVRSGEDVKKVRELLKGSGIKVIAKIEDEEGVKNFKDVIEESDAVMIARGDMGVEIPSEKIPLLQKRMIRECNKAGKVVIVATQMMESMIRNKNPTRAETSDVANAVLDGTDSIMLSAETSIGEHPGLVVKKMTRICLNTEKSNHMRELETGMSGIVNAITTNAYSIARSMNGRIICFTRSGYTARMISRFKPMQVITALTEKELVKKQLMISYGVNPIKYEGYEHYNVKEATKMCMEKNLLKEDDLVILVAGLYIKHTTNTITVYEVSELLK